jgi:alpha-galactosidase
VQYVHGDEAVVLMWLEAQRYGERPPALRLRGLDPVATYTDLDTGAAHHGAVLLHQGLHTGLRGDLDAKVLRLRRVGRP